jgi:hypothetical protein
LLNELGEETEDKIAGNPLTSGVIYYYIPAKKNPEGGKP